MKQPSAKSVIFMRAPRLRSRLAAAMMPNVSGDAEPQMSRRRLKAACQIVVSSQAPLATLILRHQHGMIRRLNCVLWWLETCVRHRHARALPSQQEHALECSSTEGICQAG